MMKLSLIIVFLLMMLLTAISVLATCYPLNQSTENNVTAGSWIICGAPTVYNFSLSSSSKNAIYMNTSNTALDCNGSRIHGTAVGTGVKIGYSGTRNQTLTNCIIDTFGTGIYMQSGATTGLFNAWINNVVVYNISACGAAGMYCGGYGNVTVNNSLFENNTNISNCAGTNPHGIYASSAAAPNDNRSCQGWIVENTKLCGNANSGMQFNGEMYQVRMVVRNVTACNNRGSGLNMYTLDGASVSDSSIYGNTLYGINLWRGDAKLPAKNNVITRINFSTNTAGDIMLNNNTDNYAHNNTYNGTGVISVGDLGVLNFRLFETVPIRITYVAGSAAEGAYCNYSYPSPYPRNITITENNITTRLQTLAPSYNDLYNLSTATLIATAADNLSVIYAANMKTAWGDYTPNLCNDLYINSGFRYTCGITGCNFQPTSDCANYTERTS